MGRDISVSGDKAALDAACKRLLANKIILAWIMKSCMEEYRDCTVEEIAERYIEGSPEIEKAAVNPDEADRAANELICGMNTEDITVTEGRVTYDIRFMAVAPRSGELIRLIINIEGQNNFFPGYPLIKRGIYYGSRLLSSQHGTEFVDSHYERIKKVYSVWICSHPPINRSNTITQYSIEEKNIIGDVKEKIENYDLLTVIMICLGKEKNENYTGILKLLGVLLSYQKTPEEKKRILQKDFDIKITKELESEVLSMCNFSDGIVEECIKQGLEQGLQQGMEQGLQQALRNVMDSLKLTADQAMDILKVPADDREKYKEMLQNR